MLPFLQVREKIRKHLHLCHLKDTLGKDTRDTSGLAVDREEVSYWHGSEILL